MLRNVFVVLSKKYVCRTRHIIKQSVLGWHSTRTISTGAKFYMKIYQEFENNYAYELMESKGYVKSLTLKKTSTITKEKFEAYLQKDWTNVTTGELCEAFDEISSYCSENDICISNKKFDNLIDSLTDKLKYISDEDLERIFFSLKKWPETESIRTRNYIEVWAALDDECLKRRIGWSFDKMLSFTALMYMLSIGRVSDYNYKCLQRLTSKSKQLTPSQLVQTLFFIGILRTPTIDMHNLEVKLEQHIHEFTIDELAIMAMGFFKSKTPIRNMKLITVIIEKAIENCNSIHEVSLTALLKIIRYSVKEIPDEIIYKFLDSLKPEIYRLSIMCCVHIALLGTSTLTFHKECLTEIGENLVQNMSKARLKDFERIILAFGTFNFNLTTIDLFDKVMEELRSSKRQIEIDKYGRSFACCIAYFGMLGQYPTDLIKKALDPHFLNNTYGKHVYSFGKEILTINNMSQIFCGNSDINYLEPKVITLLAKKYTDYVPDEDYKCDFNFTERIFLNIMTSLRQNRGGDNYVCGDHILPHHQRGDIIVCNDRDGKPTTVTDHFPTKTFGLIQKPPNNNNWIVLIVAGRNTIIRNTNTVTGTFMTKQRELKALGFYPALVMWNIWSTLDTYEEKISYLNKLISESISNKNV